MSMIRMQVTIECDRCGRQQTSQDPLYDDNWVMYENVVIHQKIALCPSCSSFFIDDFMQGKEVRALR